ncbi:bi-domain-containing oxidoreductase [Parerythrobacter jejuensis]|uniref:Zinc-binding dehydrogenase n=1 Tax=Parerythrobacter jejuensis TaxID=795812 RepID=A0A845AWH3_9SPHN|nr:bi-domain-containing oxidoreductase [Parerythrobacter jejuensis]MXP30877.1 zinc-binding dehydrogenase [Parerythrobacter jejuensis]MXP33637.1 zinc-binding dehydrogenase [Parerythrobacter jejuensis]
MKQVLQGLKDGRTEVADVPVPQPGKRQLLVQTSTSLVSVGTERMLVDFGKAGWIDKARQQPDKVKMVLDKVRVDGLQPTVEAVLNKLDQPLPLGYCNVGTVVEMGSGVSDFAEGDRVVSNGPHAEYVAIPTNLAARIPDAVSDDEAAFTVMAAIGLQGIRLADPTLGETVVVSGLGLIGLLCVQLLKANGCEVIGLDFDAEKLELARTFGAKTIDLSTSSDPVADALGLTGQRGVDAVVICASTDSNDPISQGAKMCRKRGRIVLVGVTGLELSRADFYEKELSFQVSCSYGPGRYDPNYEQGGNDYPLGFVRWTEQRNFEAVLGLMADGKIDIKPLISHRFSIENAADAYQLISDRKPALGVMLDYSSTPLNRGMKTVSVASAAESSLFDGPAAPKVAFIGAGNYANAVLAPAFAATRAQLGVIASAGGLSAYQVGKKSSFSASTTDLDSVFEDTSVDAIVISTRHDTHAQFVIRALNAGKSVFVEKPLCLHKSELDEIRAAYEAANKAGPGPVLSVGFNRRFAPHVRTAREALAKKQGPKAMVMTVNAGAIPSDHWTQDLNAGGGRVIGEACHFIDLLRHLADSPIKNASMSSMESQCGDTVSISLDFEDGSIGTVHYFANGSKSFPKERLEIFAGESILQLDNFRKLRSFGWPGVRNDRLMRQDKGQRAFAAGFVEAVSGEGAPPIPVDQIFEIAETSIQLVHDS